MNEIDSNSPGSWRGVLLVLIVLVGMIAAIGGVWWQIAPHPPSDLERYLPNANGGSSRYRVTDANGAIHFRSSNVAQLSGTDVITGLDGNAFGSLLKTLGIDVQNFDVTRAQAAINANRFVQLTEIETDPAGVYTRTMSLLLPRATSWTILKSGTASFDPPLPIFDLVNPRRQVIGKVNGSVPYTATLALENREAIDTSIGRMDDCLRVRRRIEIPGYGDETLTWYCSGVGVTREEYRVDGDPGIQRAELVSLTTPNFVKSAVLSPGKSVSDPARVITLDHNFPGSSDRALAVLWEFKENRSNNGITTPPLPVDNMLLYGTQNGSLIALNRTTREMAWRFQTGSTIYSAPTIVGDTVYATSSDRRLYALQLNSGTFLWAFATQDSIAGSPAFADGLIYIASEDRRVYALDALTGRERWRFAAGGPLATSPVIADGVIYIGSDDGALYALDAKTGAVRWAFVTGDAITTGAVVADGVVYVSSNNKMLYALQAQTQRSDGELLWQSNVRQDVAGKVVIAAGQLYVATSQQVRALDAATGQERWRWISRENLSGSPVRLGNTIFIRRSHDVVGLDTQTGSARWTIPGSESAAYAELSSDGREIFVGHFDGLLMVLGEGNK